MRTRLQICAALAAAAIFGGCSTQVTGGSGDAAQPGDLYQRHCAACHGESGEGTAAGGALGELHVRYGAATMREIVLRGVGTMPGIPSLSEEQAAALTEYLLTNFPPDE